MTAHTRIACESALLGLVLGLVVVAPWTTGGYVVLLDWVSGPNDTLDPGVFGLSYAGMDALPWRLLTEASRQLVGPAATGWIFVLLPVPIAAAGASHLVRSTRWPSYAAALLATCSPLIADRVTAGHVGYLLAISLLPWLTSSALNARARGRWISARLAGWYALSVALNPHAAWMGGLVLVAVTFSQRPSLRDLTRLAVTTVAAMTVYAYAVGVLLVHTPRVSVTDADLSAFATESGPGGLLVTVLTLHGFWRGGPGQVREVLGSWSIPLAVLLLTTITAGIVRLVVRRDRRGRLAAVLVVSGALLALGGQGPTGELYAWAFDHVPLFAIMREPAKWLAIVALGFMVGIASGVTLLQERLGSSDALRRTIPALLALAPLLMLPALGLGLGGRISASTYPDSWAAVDRITASQSGSLLALPWHGYQPYPFTGRRSVATPVSSYLSVDVLQSDNLELGPLRTNSTSPRQRTLDEWVAAGGSAGPSVLVDLGVTYVMLSRGPEDPSYAWLDHQAGLTRVLRTDDVELWSVAGAAAVEDRLHRDSQVQFTLAPGAAGRVVLPEDYDPGWTLDGRPGRLTASGAVEFDAGPEGGTITYAPWSTLRWGILLSVAALVGLLGAGIIEHRNDIPLGRRARERS